MLQGLKSFFNREKVVPKIERAKSFDLTDRPFTQALLLRAAEYQDEAIQDIKEMGGHRSVPDEPSLIAFATTCANTIAYHVTIEAARSQGHNAVFLPGEPLPKYAPMVVAFSLFVLAGIQGQLKAEGIEFAFRDAAAETAKLFYLALPDDERVTNASHGIDVFRAIAQSNSANVRNWHDSLMKIIPIYVLQWTTQNGELKQVDCLALFGGMFSGLLKAVD